MPRGGRRAGAGRPKGRGNRNTARNRLLVSELARALTPRAIETLAFVMEHGKSDQARVQAACALLDRGHGKAPAQVNVAARTEVDVGYRSEAEFRAALIAGGIPEGLLPVVPDDTQPAEFDLPSEDID
jgi:hypothetical protein